MRNYISAWILITFSLSAAAQVYKEPLAGIMAGQPVYSNARGTGLLFYLSGQKDFTADFAAGGQLLPNYLNKVRVIPKGPSGKAFSAEDDQLLSYWAPGNIFAQRGTVSFFWRSRYPARSTPFPVFRVSYADHSSWDMAWLRIDWNGLGFDAFVTDIGLARTRVTYYFDKVPAPDEWIHLALAWDETEGIFFYVNGKLAARQTVSATVYDSGLDQFGTHSRIISPYQVQSAYCFMRGGDFDELRSYDRMLPGNLILKLATGKEPGGLPELIRSLDERKWRDQWWLRNGWNLPNQPPPTLPGKETSVRKVEIHDAFDIRRWYWKANDGIRETTWPGVYNMSRLPGRYDYFVLPDWDCYSGSGQSVKFTMPDEEWNHIEIWGKAWGQLTLEDSSGTDFTFASRNRNQVKSVHRVNKAHPGGKIRFDNALIEEPIGSFDAFLVKEGRAPVSGSTETFVAGYLPKSISDPSILSLISFISGRYPADERASLLAVPEEQPSSGKQDNSSGPYPFVHLLIPYKNAGSGLDGIEISFPVLNVMPTHDGLFPMNIRIKDPLWPMRDLADFSFSVKPGDSPVLWFDTRDRILPSGHALYITVTGAGADLNAGLLRGTRIKLVYKPVPLARVEHVSDRFTQVRDLYGHIVEEHPASSRLNLFNRFIADCSDLLTADPGNRLAQAYMFAATGKDRPSYKNQECPGGVPEWAFLQTEYMRRLEKLVSYYIDNRQIANGEFGGGLSDDGDLTNMWPGLAFLGIDHDKILKSLKLHLSAYYDQERPSYYASLKQRSLPLFTNGLATITTDELHALEDGIQVVAQLQLLDYGNPEYMEKGMLTALRLADDVTGINTAGHRHFRSRLYGGTQITSEDPWQWSVNRSYLVLHSAFLVARYNGNNKVKGMITGLADGLLAHRRNGSLLTDINFETDSAREDTGMARGSKPWTLFQAAYGLTVDKKYLEVLAPVNPDKGKFDKEKISARYRNEIANLAINEYINTEGSTWIDRISSFNPQIQEDRLGGVALTRTNVLWPSHFVSWKFANPENFDDVAIFFPSPQNTDIKIIAYNLSNETVEAQMSAWGIIPGKWRIRTGAGSDEIKADNMQSDSIAMLERGSVIPLRFVPGKYTIIRLSLIEGSSKEYDSLPDPAISEKDISREGMKLKIRVHNIGSAVSPNTDLVVKDRPGNIIAAAKVPAIEAPVDLHPRWKEISIVLPADADISEGIVIIDPSGKISEITRLNNVIRLNNQNLSIW